ncbi:NADH-quinone oxidoreductase subunit I [Ereboglobus sp. PH5-10]|uniref:4Fe-4S dicluster domain-containing protein n=1 Tax=Ereboglobus sp. PH5-10 TaxID=2940629 RepID=UPI002405C06B|nr:4Fe-4S dicluster domain-containing protein [Ereboglobus sp. PH5-10]MDF9827735.1 NADH-quinone oxidoreductase subunit I [Ereboglobus sp. PH5-10]
MLGLGILKGFYITTKNLVGSYFTTERLTTLEYPEVRAKLPPASRTFPFLVYDGDNPVDGLRCVACRICEKECPPQCIYIVPERDEKGKVMKKPRIFDIDYSVCMGCQICVEACPFDSIKMDNIYEIAVRDRYEPLLMHREQLSKPNTYFHEINPVDATEVDTRLAEEKRKAEARAKAAAAAKASAAAKAAAAATPAAPADAAQTAKSAPAPAPESAQPPAPTSAPAPAPAKPDESAPTADKPAAPSTLNPPAAQ